MSEDVDSNLARKRLWAEIVIRRNLEWMRYYVIGYVLVLVLSCLTFMLVEAYIPYFAGVEVRVLSGIVTSMSIVYSASIFLLQRKSYLLGSNKLYLLLFETFFVGMGTAIVWFFASGRIPSGFPERFAVDMLYFSFEMVIFHVAFLISCLLRYEEDMENIRMKLILPTRNMGDRERQSSVEKKEGLSHE